jgi:hypothetical protein
LSDDPALPLSKQSFTAATPDGSVFVRVAVVGHILGVQLEPAAMRGPGHELAQRVMACADVAYLQGQVAVRSEWERAGMEADSTEGMPTRDDLARAEDRLRKL